MRINDFPKIFPEFLEFPKMSTTSTFEWYVQHQLDELQRETFVNVPESCDFEVGLATIMRSAKKYCGVAYESVQFELIRSHIAETLKSALDNVIKFIARDTTFQNFKAPGARDVLQYMIAQLNNAKTPNEYIIVLANFRSAHTQLNEFKYVNTKNTFLEHFSLIDANKKKIAEQKLKQEMEERIKQDNEKLKQENEKLKQDNEKLQMENVDLKKQLDNLKSAVAGILKC